jgi:hypothetical protein
MSVQLRTRTPMLRPRRLRQAIALLAVALLAASAQGCATQPTSLYAATNPADPTAKIPAVRYRSTLGPYRSERPVEPVPWREQNERVAPAPKQ